MEFQYCRIKSLVVWSPPCRYKPFCNNRLPETKWLKIAGKCNTSRRTMLFWISFFISIVSGTFLILTPNEEPLTLCIMVSLLTDI